MPGTNTSTVDTKKLPLSLIDDLTQLCNRRFIFNYMNDIIVKNKAPNKKSALIMADVDGFKKINDTFGHQEGDGVLVELSKMLEKTVGGKGIVARYAGDEFVILLPAQDEKQALKISETILQNMTTLKWPAKNKDFKNLGLSMGVAVYPDEGASLEELISHADQALYVVKKTGKNKFLFYKSIDKEVGYRTKIERVLLKPPFVNRIEEQESLRKLYKISSDGKKQAILIEGEAGIGKTRLLEEFSIWVRKQNGIFLYFELRQKEEGGPLAGLAGLLRAAAGSADKDHLKDIFSKLSQPELAEILYLDPKLKVYAKEASVKTKPADKAVNLFSGLCNILANIAAGKPIVLAADGLHYANHITLQFLSTLVALPELNKLMLVSAFDKNILTSLTGIPAPTLEYLKKFLSRDIFALISPKPLTKNEVDTLIASVFPGIKIEPEMLENIYRISKGNPLLLSEMLKTFFAEGDIEHDGKGWKFKTVGAKDIPASLQDIVYRRLKLLDDETKQILSYAAAIGGKFELGILEKFSGQKEGHILDLLDRAQDAGIIISPDLSYEGASFRADSTREALIDTLPRENAVQIHQKIAGLIKQYYKNEIPTQANRLLYHFDQAMDKNAGLEYAELAERLNEGFSLSRETTDFLEKIERQLEMPVSIEELLERPLSEASAKIVKKAILAIRSAVIGTMLYPVDNKMRVDLLRIAYERLLQILENDPILTFTRSEGQLVINGNDLKQLNIKEDTAGFTFVNLMGDYNLNSITFKQGLGREELAYFLYYFTSPEEELKEHGGLGAVLREGNIAHIRIDEVKYEKVSELTKKAMRGLAGPGGGGKAEGLSWYKPQDRSLISEIAKDNLLTMPVEQYFDPKIINKLGLISEGLILSKDAEKVKEVVNKISKKLNIADVADKPAFAAGAARVGEVLLAYEKFDALKTLTDALINRCHQSSDPKEFSMLYEGLQKIAGGLINKNNFEQARTIIEHFKQQIGPGSSRTPDQKKIVEAELRKVAHPKVIEALIEAFRKKLKSDYGNIEEVLVELGPYALDLLLNLLKEEETSKQDPFELYTMRRSVAGILKKIGQPAKDALKEMLTDRRAYVVRNVVEVFGYIGDKDIVPLLDPCLRNASPQVRMQCTVTLKKIGTKESLKLLSGALKDKDSNIRQAASSAIMDIADKSFIKELEPLLSDKSVKDIAEATIKKLKGKKDKKEK